MLATHHLANLRDVASTVTALRPGVLLRSDAPRPWDQHHGYATVWPPSTVIDLREAPEFDGKHPLAGIAEVVWSPILGGSDGRLEDLAGFNASLLEGGRARRLASNVATIAEAEAPVLVHCTGGKDRTGALIALILSLLGIDRHAIVEDYRLTDDNVEPMMERIRMAGTTNDHLAQMAPIGDARRAKAETITAVLDAWDGHDGGVHGWFHAHGGGSGVVSRLRHRLLR
jgi:rhodanese-related sulfurtransferase